MYLKQAPSEGMFIIISGSVEIYLENAGDKNILAELNDRDFLVKLHSWILNQDPPEPLQLHRLPYWDFSGRTYSRSWNAILL